MHGSITSKTFAETPEDLESRYPYQYWIPEENCLILSKLILDGDTLSAGNGVLIKNPTTGAWVTTATTTYYSLYTTTYSTGDFLRLYYNDVTGWEAWLPDQVRRTSTNWTIYYSAYGSGTLPAAVYTNGVSLPSPFTSGGSTLPSDIPPFDNVEEAINNALNATTGTTTQANQIQSTVNTNLDSYKNGDITSSDMQNVINTAVSDLETLNQNSTNTLADQIAINNALTATQTAQDQVLSNELIEAINEKYQWNLTLEEPITASEVVQMFLEMSNNFYNQYINGSINKDQAISYIKEQQDGLNIIKAIHIDQGLPWTSANESVMQGVTEILKQTQNNINNSGDVDHSIADSFESSESQEIELLNEMIGVMQDQETDSIMQNQQVQEDLGQVSNWLEPIWNNKFFRLLIISVALLAPIAVILDMRYKGL